VSTILEDHRDAVGIILEGWGGDVDRILYPNHGLTLEDLKTDPSDPATMVEWSTFDDETERPTFGTSLMLSGRIICYVWVQRGSTDLKTRQLADSLATLFSDASVAGADFFEAELGAEETVDPWFVRAIEIPYLYQGVLVGGKMTLHPQASHGFTSSDVPTLLEPSGATYVAAPTAWPWLSTVALLVGVPDADNMLIQETPAIADVTISGSAGDSLYRSRVTAGALVTTDPGAGGGWQRIGGKLVSGRFNFQPGIAELV